MSKDKLSVVQDRLAEIHREAEELETFLRVAKRFNLDVSGSEAKPASAPSPQSNGKATSGKIKIRKDSWGGLAAQMITKHGPLTLPKIVEELIKQGKDQGKELKKLKNTVNAALWRRGDLFEIKDGSYCLKIKDFSLTESDE